MTQKVGYVAVVVRDYDEALTYFINVLGFELIEDTFLDREKRWVVVAPPVSQGTCLLLARAVTDEQASRVGNQTGGRVFLFLHTDDFWRDYHAMKERGVNFQEAPREESYGTVAVFQDICGNRWDLLQMNKTSRESQAENQGTT
jgi:lactoylglutathione lyase